MTNKQLIKKIDEIDRRKMTRENQLTFRENNLKDRAILIMKAPNVKVVTLTKREQIQWEEILETSKRMINTFG